MANLDKSFGDVIILPPTAQDYSAEVAQATTGADCVIGIISETPYITWNTVWTQSGTEARQYGPQGNLNEVSAAGNEEATDGDIIVGMYPDISTDPWSEYRLALEEAELDTSEVGLQAPAGRHGHLGGVSSGSPRSPRRSRERSRPRSLDDVASTTSSLDLNGMVPELDFTQEWTDGLEDVAAPLQQERRGQPNSRTARSCRSTTSSRTSATWRCPRADSRRRGCTGHGWSGC